MPLRPTVLLFPSGAKRLPLSCLEAGMGARAAISAGDAAGAPGPIEEAEAPAVLENPVDSGP